MKKNTTDEIRARYADDPWISERITETGKREAAMALHLEAEGLRLLKRAKTARAGVELLRQAGIQKKVALAADRQHDLVEEAKAIAESKAADELAGKVVKLARKQ